MTVLNRILEFNKATGILQYEADPRHAETVVKLLGLESAKPLATPAEKMTSAEVLKAMEMLILPPEQASTYRSIMMRGAYLSQDRLDLCEATKTLARYMSAPTEDSWGRHKRVADTSLVSHVWHSKILTVRSPV